jgi:nucleotide-binding universal stress UspA family protein
MNATTTAPEMTRAMTIFDRVVCGVDRSAAGELAARAAARVTAPTGSLALVSVEDSSLAVHAGWAMANVAELLASEAELALARGESAAAPWHRVDARLLRGDPLHSLLAEIERERATLAVVGSHGLTRVTGIALGAVSTYLLHEAPCAVLVARGPIDAARWPRSIVAGVDGSPESDVALVAARELAERYGASLRAIVATRDAPVDLERAHELADDVEEHPLEAVDALAVLSEHTDLVVVGSRGLRGVRALGSVSERIAHEARCPVLAVRDSVHPKGPS